MSFNALPPDLILQPYPWRATRRSSSEQRPTFLAQHIQLPFITPAVIPAFWCLDSTVSGPTGVVLSCAPPHHQSYERVHSRSSKSQVLNRPFERYYRGIEAMLSELRGKKRLAVAEQQRQVGDLTALQEAREVLENELDTKNGLRSPPVYSDEEDEGVSLSQTAATTFHAPRNHVAHSKSPTPPFNAGPSTNEPSSMISMATEAMTEAAEDPLVTELFENYDPRILRRMRPIIGRPGARTESERLPIPGAIPHTVNPAATMKPPTKRKRPSDPVIYSPDSLLNHDTRLTGNVEEGYKPPSKRTRRGLGKAGVSRDEPIDPPSDLRRNVVVQQRTKRALPSPPPAISAVAIMEADSVIPVASLKRSRWKLRGSRGLVDRIGESMGAAGSGSTTGARPIPTPSRPPIARVSKSRPRTGAVTRTSDSAPVPEPTSIPFHSPPPSSSHARIGTRHTGTSSGMRQSPVAVSSPGGAELSSGPRRSARIKSNTAKIATSVLNNTQQPSRRLRSTNATNASAPAGTTRGRLRKSSVRGVSVNNNSAPRRKKD